MGRMRPVRRGMGGGRVTGYAALYGTRQDAEPPDPWEPEPATEAEQEQAAYDAWCDMMDAWGPDDMAEAADALARQTHDLIAA